MANPSRLLPELEEIIQLREALVLPYKNLAFGDYGIGPEVRERLLKPMGPEPTYSDLLVWLQRNLGASIYLEIGTSIGKNIFHALNLFQPPCHCIGIDLENVHPDLRALLIEEQPATYRFGGNRYTHIRGSVFEQSTWKNLTNVLNNAHVGLVYSDACHSAQGLLAEFSYLQHFINWSGHFALLYDDLSVDGIQRPYYPEMCFAFAQIYSAIQSRYSPSAQASLVRIRGWCGMHLGHHTMGLITNWSSSAEMGQILGRFQVRN